MARVTVEDCLDNVDTRIPLVLITTRRARQLAKGSAQPGLPWENDKPTVMALREIAEGLVDASILDQVPLDEPVHVEMTEADRGDLEPAQVEDVRRACDFAADAHAGQQRASGEPYVQHPIAVARILAEMRMDHESIMAAILHDVIEDTPTAKEQIATQFGTEVAELVDGVSKLTQIRFSSKAEAQAENFRKMMLAMVRDIRVILV